MSSTINVVSSRRIFSVIGWSAVIALGTACIAVLAWHRGEPLSALWMVVAALCVFAISYRFHSAWLMAKVFALDELTWQPEVFVNDMPLDARRLRRPPGGYRATIVAGVPSQLGGTLTEQRPGRLLRRNGHGR